MYKGKCPLNTQYVHNVFSIILRDADQHIDIAMPSTNMVGKLILCLSMLLVFLCFIVSFTMSATHPVMMLPDGATDRLMMPPDGPADPAMMADPMMIPLADPMMMPSDGATDPLMITRKYIFCTF